MRTAMDRYRDKHRFDEGKEQEVEDLLESLKDTFGRIFEWRFSSNLTPTEKERIESAIRIINKQDEKLIKLILKRNFPK